MCVGHGTILGPARHPVNIFSYAIERTHKSLERAGHIGNTGGMNIGKQISQARLALGWTQRKLADAAGVDPQNVSKIELGKHVPSGKTLAKLAKALGLKIELAARKGRRS